VVTNNRGLAIFMLPIVGPGRGIPAPGKARRL
jgi:hypothetical protein